MPETSAVAYLNASVTLYCHRCYLADGPFPCYSGGYSCLQDYVSHWRWTACHLMRWSSFPFI
ncbi:hypothetical protein GSO30_004394 [Salmonella enterica]|nr:hypothetical protein [Salmonella enterica]